MTCLGFWGGETGHVHAEGLTLVGTTLTFDTGTKRTGTRSFKLDTSATITLRAESAGATGRGWYACGHFLIPAASGLPGADTRICDIATSTPTTLYSVMLTTTGKLQLWSNSPAKVGSDSAATVTTDTWYRVELFTQIGAAGSDDSAELRLDGVTVASESNQTRSTTAPGMFRFGWLGDPGTSEVIFWDDLALNDSTGSVNNTWVGEHEVRLLLPTADSAIGSWTNGAAGGTNLFEAVNNTPPTGVATASSGATNQIEITTTANSYDATMQSYTAAGVTGTIAALFPVAELGSSSTGADAVGVGIVSNPTVANVTTNNTGTASGTYPTNWARAPGTMTENPTVTLGTAPVMRVTRIVASARINAVCLMGISVDSVPAAAAAVARRRSIMMIG